MIFLQKKLYENDFFHNDNKKNLPDGGPTKGTQPRGLYPAVESLVH